MSLMTPRTPNITQHRVSPWPQANQATAVPCLDSLQFGYIKVLLDEQEVGILSHEPNPCLSLSRHKYTYLSCKLSVLIPLPLAYISSPLAQFWV